MSTEFPDDPEVDLGFRDPDPEFARTGSNDQLPQLEDKTFVRRSLPVSPSVRGWLLRILLVIAFSACGGLISSVFLFNVPERLTVLRHLVRETYILPPAGNDVSSATIATLSIDRVANFEIGNELGVGFSEPKGLEVLDPFPPPSPQWLPPDGLYRFVQDASLFSATQSGGPLYFPSRLMLASKNEANLTAETPTKSDLRSAVEKRSVRKTALRRRSTPHIARKTRPRPSFWSIWSRHFLASGTAVSTRRRSGKRESRKGKAKQSFWFASSWRAIGSQPNQRKDRTKSVSGSRASARQDRSLHHTTHPPR
jgi:hypothetical protein